MYADHPAFAAHRAAPDRFFGQFRLRAAVIFGRRLRNVRRRERFPAPRQACFAVAVGEYAEEPDALVAPWQDVYQEARDELIGPQRHDTGFLLLFRTVVLPLKGDFTVLDIQQTFIRESDPVGVASQIAENLAWTSERAPG